MFTKLLNRLKNDFHVPLAILIFAITTTVHVWTKRDLGPQYVNSLYAMYFFLGGHAGAQMWKDVRTIGDSNDTPSGSTPPPSAGS